MINLGKINTLEIERESPHGLYLTDNIGNEVLLPNKYVTTDMEIGQDLSVFIYKDSEGRNVATTETPKLQVGEIALLEVFDVSEVGAFMEWGIEKHLFIPFREQGRRLMAGDETLVYMYLDEETHRLVGTTKISRYLSEDTSKLKVGEGVSLIMWHPTLLGYTAIINGDMMGLVYQDDIYEEINPGDIKHGFIKRIREDGKIDLSLRPFGYNKVTAESQKILDYLEKHDGSMIFTDKSSTDDIAKAFRMSKKVFKKALGLLYKQKLIILEKDHTRLAEALPPKVDAAIKLDPKTIVERAFSKDRPSQEREIKNKVAKAKEVKKYNSKTKEYETREVKPEVEKPTEERSSEYTRKERKEPIRKAREVKIEDPKKKKNIRAEAFKKPSFEEEKKVVKAPLKSDDTKEVKAIEKSSPVEEKNTSTDDRWPVAKKDNAADRWPVKEVKPNLSRIDKDEDETPKERPVWPD